MSFFSTIWRNQITKLLPPEVRSNSLTDWLTSLTWPLQVTLSGNSDWEQEIRRRARYNSQKIVLQDALNTIFSQPANTIIVETNQSLVEANYTYNEAEGIDVFSYNESEIGNPPIYLYNESEAVAGYDFLIKVPVGIYTAELDRQITAEVNTYKLAGKLFDIVTY